MKAVCRYLFISADVTMAIWKRRKWLKSKLEKWRHLRMLFQDVVKNMQHLTMYTTFPRMDSKGGVHRLGGWLRPFYLTKKKKDPCNPSILEAKKILIRRAITRARGKSPLMKFPVDHMQFVSSQWTTNCKGRYQGVSVLSAVNWLVKQVQILYPHSHVRNREHINLT